MNLAPTVIAEAGVNHNGSVEMAHELIRAAKESGADVVKFQTYDTDRLTSKKTPKVAYQMRDTSSGSHYEMLKRLELPRSAYVDLVSHCDELNIEFMSTPYGIREAAFLLELGVRRFKVASADIVDLPLHQFLAEAGRPTIISTGMASPGEISDAISIYMEKGTQLVLMHTTSEYPTRTSTTNMSRLLKLREFGTDVGFSDHTIGSEAAIMAVALGSIFFERHLTIDKSQPGPDHAASIEPPEFRRYVARIHNAYLRLGNGEFGMTLEEKQMAQVSRKSIHTARFVPADTMITEQDLVLMRPGDGLPWKDRSAIIGARPLKDLMQGHLITLEDLER